MAKTGPKTKYHEKRKIITFRTTAKDRENFEVLRNHFEKGSEKGLSQYEILSKSLTLLATLLARGYTEKGSERVTEGSENSKK